MQTELRLENIWAGYGKKEILRGVSLTVREGEIVALIGPNGAGKSTLLKVAMGLVPLWKGSVWLSGRDLTSVAPHRRVREGLAYLIQGGEIFPSLTVKENLEMGTRNGAFSERNGAVEKALELFPFLQDSLNRRAGLLSGGQRHALALGMVLCQRPRVLLLDEPSAGLAPKLAQDILNRVRELNQRLGITIVLVEQRVREALQVAQRAVALVNGTLAAETDEPAGWLSEGTLEVFFFGRTKQPIEN